jgi:hypothetical protein
MAKKIYLSTYSIKVLDRDAEVVLNQFNGKDDFYDFFKDFADHIYQNIKKTQALKDKVELHIMLDQPVKGDKDARHLYGYISSGVGGDRYKVRTNGETATKFESDPDKDITFRDLFFYLKLPLNSTFGYLILQKKRDFGAKTSIQRALNQYLKEKGYNHFIPVISNMLNGRVFDRMMSMGNLKNIDLIRKSIPSTIEDFYENGPKQEKGILTTSIRSPSSLSGYWKDFIKLLYTRDYKDSIIELNGGMDSLDEIDFELELNGKKKTFHIKQKSKTLPDVEVSDDLEFNTANEPTPESMVRVSESLINDMLTLQPNVPTN